MEDLVQKLFKSDDLTLDAFARTPFTAEASLLLTSIAI